MKLQATLFDRVRNAAETVDERLDAAAAEVAVVLGSGLGGVADRLEGARAALYATLPGFPETTVTGHAGRLVIGSLAGHKTLLLCGRVHGYEGYAASEVGFGVRVAAALGVQTLIVTNAAGGIDPTMAPGEIVAIADQLNLTGTSALGGPNDERLGPRFVDMTDAYSPALRALAALAAPASLGRPLREAVYAGVAGPAYETPADAHAAHAGRGAGRDVDRARGDHRASCRPGGAGPVAGLQPRRGREERAPSPRRRHPRRRRRLRRAGGADRGGDRFAAAAG